MGIYHGIARPLPIPPIGDGVVAGQARLCPGGEENSE